MGKRYFSYNVATKCWQETNCREITVAMTEKVSVVFLLEDKEHGAYAWCPRHRSYETVQTLEEGKITTVDGCVLRGAVVPLGDKDITAEELPSPEEFELRWHVSRNRRNGTMMIGVDRAVIGLGNGWDSHRGRVGVPHVYERTFHSISVNYPQEKIILRGDMEKIPFAVLVAALTDMEGLAEDYYGEKMPFSWDVVTSFPNVSGIECLESVFHYPFVPFLWPLRYNFSSEPNRHLVPRDNRQGFSELCRMLHIEASSELFSQALLQPYAFIIALRLRLLGFRKSEYIEPFYELTSFCGKKMTESLRGEYLLWSSEITYDASIFQDDTQMDAFLKDAHQNFSEWDALFFYCQWNLHLRGEAAFSPIFYRMQSSWQDGYGEAIRAIQRDYLNLPKDFRKKIIEEGLTPGLCEIIQEVLTNLPHKETALNYTSQELALECQVDGYDFRLIKTVEEYMEVRAESGAVRNSYAIPICDGILLIGIYMEKMVVGCFEWIQGIVEEFYPCVENDPSNPKIKNTYIAFLHWLERTGLKDKYLNFSEEDLSYLKEAVNIKQEGKPL